MSAAERRKGVANSRHLSIATPPQKRATDRLLQRLRVHGFDYRPDEREVDVWYARCPLCKRERGLRIVERGTRLLLSCASGCDAGEVVGYLLHEPSDVIIAQRDAWIDELREMTREALALARNLARQVSVLEGTIDRALEGAPNGG